MYDLTLIKQDGGTYIDSRDVAELIGKRHSDLLRDIKRYSKYMWKITERKIAFSDFFLESSYLDNTGRTLRCYLITKMGCEMVANKLTGEKGILFTALYVAKFNEMENAERAEIEAQLARSATPHLKVFNTAVRNVLEGFADTYATPNEVMEFLRGAYKPFGIDVIRESGTHYLTATNIAMLCGIVSESGRPHGHAVASIIGRLNIASEHMVIVPYGMVGISMRYDEFVLEEVRRYISENNLPKHVPHQGFTYHIYYDPEWLFLYDKSSYIAGGDDDYFDDDYDFEDFTEEDWEQLGMGLNDDFN